MTSPVKWTEFSAGSTVAGSNISVGVQAGANVQWTMNQLATFFATPSIDLSVVSTSATAFRVRQTSGPTTTLNASTLDAYSGTGTGTTGAPRLFLGTNASSGDDSALLIGRAVAGDSLFSHAIRDESTFISTTTGAYTPFDASPTINGSIHYNHTRGFQYRAIYSGAGTIDEIAAFWTQPSVTAGTTTNLYGLKVNDPGSSGTITNQYGIWIDPLSRGGTNYAIYVSGANSTYLGGTLQVTGTWQLNNTGAITYSDNSFARGVTFKNTNAGTSALAGMLWADKDNNAKGAVDYYPSNYANPAIADYFIVGANGSAHLALASNTGTVALTIDASQNMTASTSFVSPLIGTGAISSSTFLNLAAGTTAKSALRFIQGAAPTSPVDGDVWREDNTNSGLKIRVNGVTKTITLS